MSDFPKGGNVDSTRVWLDKEGFAGLFLGWKADALLGKGDEFIKSRFPLDGDSQDKAEMLCGLLNSARQHCNSIISLF